MPDFPDPTSMQRYSIDSIAIAPDLGSMMVRFIDPSKNTGGPVLAEVHEMTISLRGDDDLRSIMWDVMDRICDVIDEAHKARRLDP